MKKFFVLFEIPFATIDEWRKTTDDKQMKAAAGEMMTAWSRWMEEHGNAFADAGKPLGKTKRVTPSGSEDVRNDLSYYAVVEAATHEAAAEMFVGHPHLRIPSSFIEVMEISEMSPA